MFRFEIEPALYRRAITTPIDPPRKNEDGFRALAATVGAVLAIVCTDLALFGGGSLVPLSAGACLGAILVLLVWWRQHRHQVSMHAAYNQTGGEMALRFDPKRIVASRPGIESHVEWRFVRAVRHIDGAILIELPTARLILPETALPTEMNASDLLRTLSEWHRKEAP
ncbi:hypothetical protein [Palleronia sp. THAF1]|uniref:hypothetical protein n=1 Tax=Palleronia sp. THAF1 TaxID=2587842 RepID=UPI000F536E90|nr:hypothetical protein [Palleronia sp. THAF1]